MSEEKKLTDEEIVKALKCCMRIDGCDKCPLVEIPTIEQCRNNKNKCALDLIKHLKGENERLKINLANEKKWGKIQAKQAEKETAREILGELDLFFKGTTFRKGYEFKKIDEKLKEMAKRYDVGVEYEN